jgi:hypothetical protein
MSVGATAWILGITIAALALGLFLARFNVFALVVASGVSAALFMCYLMLDSTLVRSVVLSAAAAFVVQVGYLFGQFLQKPSGCCRAGQTASKRSDSFSSKGPS